MLLDRERPKMVEGSETPGVQPAHPQVGGVAPQVKLFGEGNIKQRCLDQPWYYPQTDGQREEIEGKNPEGSSRKEIAEIVWPVFGTKQDPGDEEARKDEEEVDAAFSDRCQASDGGDGWMGLRIKLHAQAVEGNREDSHATNSVQSIAVGAARPGGSGIIFVVLNHDCST